MQGEGTKIVFPSEIQQTADYTERSTSQSDFTAATRVI